MRERRCLKGLHRPFNMPLKSLYWVCSFASSCAESSASSFYLDFYLSHLKVVISHQRQFENCHFNKGMISPEEAIEVLQILNSSKESPIERVNQVLRKRESAEDRLLYKTYKNTTYYISLAKKLQLLLPNYRLSTDGWQLVQCTNKQYLLSPTEQRLYLSWIIEANPELMFALLLTYQYKDNLLYHRFLEFKGNSAEGRYVRSYDKNYVEVLRYWLDQLDVFTEQKKVRKVTETYIKASGNESQYQEYKQSVIEFYNQFVLRDSRKAKLYKTIDRQYNKLVRDGKVEVGYVNLYDLKSAFRMSYERFSKLINDYYQDKKSTHVILLSNTVASIDMRKRFVVNGQVAMNIKIIEKKKANEIK